ncbi:hypothetical protein NESM_000214600 [Novymonas esmeraldas]|uniref:Uncharacterized protein n=1 Tax=Novymonas esmeraldas TaxID=1808958 RepID=A0AAW0F5H2_9TRYP
MAEFTVEKRGSLNASHWTQRVLTIYTTSLGLVSITRQDQPTEGAQRTMRVSSVQLWPTYKPSSIKEKQSSVEAMLSLRIKGDYVRVHRDFAESKGDSQAATRFTKRATTADEATWMLRFSSFDDLAAAARLLATMTPAQYFEKFEREKRRAKLALVTATDAAATADTASPGGAATLADEEGEEEVSAAVEQRTAEQWKNGNDKNTLPTACGADASAPTQSVAPASFSSEETEESRATVIAGNVTEELEFIRAACAKARA